MTMRHQLRINDCNSSSIGFFQILILVKSVLHPNNFQSLPSITSTGSYALVSLNSKLRSDVIAGLIAVEFSIVSYKNNPSQEDIFYAKKYLKS